MQDDHVKQHRLKENEEFYVSVFNGFRDLIKNFQTELTKDKSGLRIYQDPNGITPEQPKTGLRIFREGGLKEVAKAVVDNAVAQVKEVANGVKEQAKDVVLDTVDVAARNFVKDREAQRHGQEESMKSIEQAFAEVIAPPEKEAPPLTDTLAEEVDNLATPSPVEPAKEADQPAPVTEPVEKTKKEADQPTPATEPVEKTKKEADQPTPATEPVKKAETEKETGQSAIPPAAETTEVKDRLLYADNNLKPEMTMPDMLAVAELFTAQRGDRLAGLAGDAAKNLVVEFNGHLLLRTDKEGQVQVNNLQNQEILANFTFREKNQIADSIAQFEALKPQLKKAIQLQTPADIQKLISGVEQKLQDSKPNLEKAEAQTPAALPATSPSAQEIHQGIGSKRIDGQAPAPSINEQAPDTPQSRNIPPDPYVHRRAYIVFNTGDIMKDRAEGSIQASSGTIIHKTIIDQETKAFDISVEHDGRKHYVGTCRGGKWEFDQIVSDEATELIEDMYDKEMASKGYKYSEYKPLQGYPAATVPEPKTEVKSFVQQLTPEMLQTCDRLARVAAVAFNSNYKGDLPAQGSLQTPAGTIIHKTITDHETKAFDISVERDGQNHHVASYRGGAWTIQEGMMQAAHLLREISTQINHDGEFIQPEVKPRQEVAQQINTQQYEPERDYAR